MSRNHRRSRTTIALALQVLLAVALGVGGVAMFEAQGSAWLERLQSNGMRVESPEFAWLLLALPVLIILRLFSRSDFPWYQQLFSWVLKATAIALATASLMDIRDMDSEAEGTSLVFVVDVSESVPDAMMAEAAGFIDDAVARANQMSEEQRPVIKVVAFAEKALQVDVPSEAGARVVLNRMERGSTAPGTDIGAGLRLGLGLMPEGRQGRIVLVTDGHRTRGSLSAEIDVVKRFGVPVDYLTFKDMPIRRELVVSGVEAPQEGLKPRIPFEITASMSASVAMAVICRVDSEGVELTRKELELATGKHEERFEVKLDGGGKKPLSVTCDPTTAADDGFAGNNRFDVIVSLEEKPKLLYVEGEQRLRHNLTQALDDEFDVEVRGARGTPANLADAKKFDLIVISDVPRLGENGLENMSTAQMRTLESYVRDGGGLLVAGGENSFGPGGYGQTAMERDILPLRLDVQRKQDTPSLALVLAIDRSGSMSGPKMELAKQAAIETLNVLQSSDLLGVFPFDTKVIELVPLQRAANRFKITDALSRLTPGGGTNIFVGLDAAYNALVRTEAKVKHIILMTDGQSNRAGIVELATQASLDRITISTVAVGVGSDTDLLRRVAEAAGGRYYFTNTPTQLPQLFLKETSEVTRKALVEDRFRPRLDPRYRSLQMFTGVDMSRMPPLLGYVSTRAKPQAEVLMTSHLGEPVLARWRLGLGRVVAWTSDVKNKWSHLWLSWPGYAKFWRQVVRDHLRVTKGDPEMAIETSIVDEHLVVALDAIDDQDRFIDGMRHDVKVTTPDGESHALTLTQIAAGRYEGRFRMTSFGPHTIEGLHAEGDPADPTGPRFRSRQTRTWPFPDEYAATAPHLNEIRTLAQVSGGTENPSHEHLFQPSGAHTIRESPRWRDFLPWILIVLVLDVMLRRVRFEGRLR